MYSGFMFYLEISVRVKILKRCCLMIGLFETLAHLYEIFDLYETQDPQDILLTLNFHQATGC